MTIPKSKSKMDVQTPWLTLGEAAARARVSTSTICLWISLGKLKAHKVISKGTKGITRYRVEEIDGVIERGGAK